MKITHYHHTVIRDAIQQYIKNNPSAVSPNNLSILFDYCELITAKHIERNNSIHYEKPAGYTDLALWSTAYTICVQTFPSMQDLTYRHCTIDMLPDLIQRHIQESTGFTLHVAVKKDPTTTENIHIQWLDDDIQQQAFLTAQDSARKPLRLRSDDHTYPLTDNRYKQESPLYCPHNKHKSRDYNTRQLLMSLFQTTDVDIYHQYEYVTVAVKEQNDQQP